MILCSAPGQLQSAHNAAESVSSSWCQGGAPAGAIPEQRLLLVLTVLEVAVTLAVARVSVCVCWGREGGDGGPREGGGGRLWVGGGQHVRRLCAESRSCGGRRTTERHHSSLRAAVGAARLFRTSWVLARTRARASSAVAPSISCAPTAQAAPFEARLQCRGQGLWCMEGRAARRAQCRGGRACPPGSGSGRGAGGAAASPAAAAAAAPAHRRPRGCGPALHRSQPRW